MRLLCFTCCLCLICLNPQLFLLTPIHPLVVTSVRHVIWYVHGYGIVYQYVYILLLLYNYRGVFSHIYQHASGESPITVPTILTWYQSWPFPTSSARKKNSKENLNRRRHDRPIPQKFFLVDQDRRGSDVPLALLIKICCRPVLSSLPVTIGVLHIVPITIG
jgi:hypothetical protein